MSSSSRVAEDSSAGKGEGCKCNWRHAVSVTCENPKIQKYKYKVQEDEIKMLFGEKNLVKVLQVSKGNLYCQSKMMDKESIFHYAVTLTQKHNAELYCIQRNYLSTQKAGVGSLTDAVYVIPSTSLPSNPPLSLRSSCFNGKDVKAARSNRCCSSQLQ